MKKSELKQLIREEVSKILEHSITADDLLDGYPRPLIVNKDVSVKGVQFKKGDIVSVKHQFDDDDESFYYIKGYGPDTINIYYITKEKMDVFLKSTSLYRK